MKRLLTSLFFLFITVVSFGSDDTYVYICTGPQSKCYHKNEFCRGLKSCSKEIKKVTLTEAKEKYHRRACGYCYKK